VSSQKHPNPSPFRRAKIVCTLGPATRTPEVVGHLIDEGMDVARLNFSHGTAEDHRRMVAILREQAAQRGRAVAILQDLQGPKIRVGKIAPGTVLEAGGEFTLTTEEIVGDANRASTTYSDLPRDVRAGDVMLLDDGLLQLEVLDIEGEEVITRVLVGGPLSNNKGINLPGVAVSAPSLSDKDRADLRLGQELGVDFLALSFVRSPEDVLQARALIAQARAELAEAEGGAVGPERALTPIIAKIEKPEAVERLAEIVDVADGIMIARGDLGVELGPEKVPLIQKAAIELTNVHGKLVITATQMLESMTVTPRPTRAEASDVANAVLDGTDAVMLSAETASGKYPLLAVRTMVRIIREVEQSARFHQVTSRQAWPKLQVTSNAVAHAAVVASRQMRAPVIVAVSDSGGVVRLLSEYRPDALVVAFTPRREVYNQLAAYWGVVPIMAPVESIGSAREMVEYASRVVRERGYARAGQMMVVTLAMPFGSGLPTNTMQLHVL
jgi:pyruvate kinase